MKINKKLLFRLFILLAPVVFYTVAIIHYSVDIPHTDDYDEILAFHIELGKTQTFGEYAKLLTSQSHEYRFLVRRAIGILDSIFFGKVNFVHFILAGNIALFILLILIYKSFQAPDRVKLTSFLPVPFILFQFQYWEASTWAMLAPSLFYVFMGSFSCLYLLNKNTWPSFIGANVIGMLAPFASFNGLFILPFGLLLLAQKKEYKKMLFFSCLSFIFIVLYFSDFTTSGINPTKAQSGLGTYLETVLKRPDYLLSAFFAYLGSAPAFGFKHLSIAIGIGIFIWFCFLTYKRYYAANPVVYFFIAFLLTTALGGAFLRAWIGTEFFIDLILYTSRYRLVSTLILVACFISFIENINSDTLRKLYARKFLIYAIFFCVISNLVYMPFLSGRHHALASGNIGLSNNNPQYAYKIITEAEKIGIYHLPDGYLNKIDPKHMRTAESKLENFLSRFDSRGKRDTTLTLRINIPHNNIFDSTFHVFLQKPAVIYLFNSGLTPTTIREVLHGVNPDAYKSKLVITNNAELKK